MSEFDAGADDSRIGDLNAPARPTVKSPVWAMVMLAFCALLRFCDPIIFGKKRQATVEKGRNNSKAIGKKERGISYSDGQKQAAADSSRGTFHLFR